MAMAFSTAAAATIPVATMVKEVVSKIVKRTRTPASFADRAIEVCKALLKPSPIPKFSPVLHPNGRFVALKAELDRRRSGVFALFEPSGYGKTATMKLMASRVNGLKVFSLQGVTKPIFTSFLEQMNMTTTRQGMNCDIFDFLELFYRRRCDNLSSRHRIVCTTESFYL